ncbi:hypothetical protein LEP1GSC132_1608 [Leptospira kirschneri str. 200803703]|uniref:Uncharacterized protein n=1 Tax=Leptospira kirschneri str. 200802841 TaxID=1193047 RepID=A0A828Y6L1_9LEPT|nr:hypothetical protein LEP1GSC044_2430 [Leptospira kirschneri serovar Grippotyphosa str. RM52]EKO52970.1 hypothetical protein LEP1GSC131_2202 [Leptospira kirschneri str. 200802841]EKP04167.1 hypothetical protein LEP1GSC018_3209 [Leptospira kirschneri str. 2008720114]EKQ81834.1 hypothetical protein LEP1GSC064_0062 [Leptospira kirschneri serovar Grippotyphosa str. Moskva]EKR10045.1 hypothetical protein LEP1GSC122_3079 [Leptospira kirschneri serovar Valbuzzi str. 200702274]EMJ94993.1 hypothetica
MVFNSIHGMVSRKFGLGIFRRPIFFDLRRIPTSATIHL